MRSASRSRGSIGSAPSCAICSSSRASTTPRSARSTCVPSSNRRWRSPPTRSPSAHVLETDYRPVPFARGTVARLGQVLLNLLTNALEAMPDRREGHEPSFAWWSGARPPAASSSRSPTTAWASRRSTRPRIFDPFFTTKPSGEGTGLGLAITQRLVAELGGELSFESSPRRGTTFRLTLQPEDTTEHLPSPGGLN